MKKTIYTAPQTEVVNVKVENLMQTASPASGGPNENNPTNLEDVQKSDNEWEGEFSRRRSVWDED